MKKLASATSIILHPFSITPVVFTILTYKTNLSEVNHSHYQITLLFSTIIPFITFLVLKKLKHISDYDISIRLERVLPLYLSSAYFLFGYLILYKLNANIMIQGLMFCYTVNTFIVALITRFWKISLHAISLSGPLTALWVQGFQHPIIMSFLVFCVCLSRWFLKAHTKSQVIGGTLFAIFFTYIELYFYLN